MKATSKSKLVAQMQEARLRADLTQQELADSMGMSRETISKMEAGRHRFSLLQGLAYVDILAECKVPSAMIPTLDDLARLP